MVRVGFAFELTASWMGGVNYFRSLITAILVRSDRKIEPVIFVGKKAAGSISKEFAGAEIVPTELFDRYSPAWIARKVVQRATNRDLTFVRLLKQHRIGVLSHSGCLGRSADIPSIGWIADLQHRRLPQLFDQKERNVRDAVISRWCRDCTALIFSSKSACGDFMNFFERPGLPVFVIPFVPLAQSPKPGAYGAAAIKYGLPEKYYFVPNQFWVHKNHQAVIEATKRLHQCGMDVDIVFTGDTNNYRGSGHYEALRKLGAGIAPKLHFLGAVPYEDVVAIMDGAIAIINPSRFEGWSTTVEEAINLGKSVLLSDIDVHLEQAPPRSIYFKLDDIEDLSEKMRQCWLAYEPTIEQALRRAHTPDVDARRRRFGEQFERCVLSVVDNNHSSA